MAAVKLPRRKIAAAASDGRQSRRGSAYCITVGISHIVWVIFGINNVTVMMHTKIIILIDVASVPSGLDRCA